MFSFSLLDRQPWAPSCIRIASPSWREPMIATARMKVRGLGHTATSAIEPRISAQAWTISATLFQVTRVRTSISSCSLRKARARMRSAVIAVSPCRRTSAGIVCADNSQPRRVGGRIGLRAEQAQHLGGELFGRAAHRLPFDGDADRDRPEAPGAGCGIEPRLPAARGHLGGIGAQAFGVQPLHRPLDQRREILAAAGQRHRLDEEADGIRPHHAFDQRAGVVRRRELFCRHAARRRGRHRARRGRRPRRTALPWCGSNR